MSKERLLPDNINNEDAKNYQKLADDNDSEYMSLPNHSNLDNYKDQLSVAGSTKQKVFDQVSQLKFAGLNSQRRENSSMKRVSIAESEDQD